MMNDVKLAIYTAKSRYRGFETMNENAIMPVRGSKKAAGYDLFVPHGHEQIVIKPGEYYKFGTGVRAYMDDDEYLAIHVRSSVGIKKHCILSNATGVIDSDYYGNPSTGGEIFIMLQNIGTEDAIFNPGDAVAQGIFQKYLLTDDDNPDFIPDRIGGIGSTSDNNVLC